MNAGYMKFMRDLPTLTKKNSFAIVGNESFFKQEAFFALVRALRKTGTLDEDRYEATDKTRVGAIDEALCEYAMIGKFRLISVNNADKIKDLKKLAFWFKEPTPDTKAIFVFTEETDRPPEELQFDVVAVCNSVGVESKGFETYIDFCLEGTGTKLHADALELTRKLFANNLHIMKQELIKTALYVSPSKEIKTADLMAATAGYPTAKVFDMVDALVQRDVRSALVLLEDLLDQGTNPTFITHLLTQRLKVLHGALRAFARGEKLKDYMIRKKIPLFQYEQVINGTKVLKDFHIRKFYDILTESEFKLRDRYSSDEHKRAISEAMVVSLC